MPFNDTRGFVLPAAVCALVLALSGCGGGSSSTGTTPPSGRSMAQLESEPVALPEGVTLATAGTFTVEPGRSVDRDGARFTCAAGGAACTVVVAERAGGGFAATVTGGRLTVARVQAAMEEQDDGQNGGMEERDWPFPDWPVADVAAARSLVSGSALSWSSSEIYSRMRAIEAHEDSRGSAPRADSEFVRAETFGEATVSAGCVTDLTAVRLQRNCNAEYSSVMTHPHGGIPIVQTRSLWGVDPDYNTGRPQEEISVGGILEHGYFMVTLGSIGIGTDDEYYVSIARYGGGREFVVSNLLPTTGRWQGALIGTGRNATSPLYRQFIVGDVDVRISPHNFNTRLRSVDVAFSNIRNLSTGDRNVTLSHMRWNDSTDINGEVRISPAGGITYRPGSLKMSFFGLSNGSNGEEILGVFHTDEAVGGFGAKKQ